MESSSYKPDLRDMEFVLFEHLDVESLLGRAAYQDVTADDVRMVLEAGADFAREILAPTNSASDTVGCRWDDGKVTIPEVFADVWQAMIEQGWVGLVAPVDQGGQGLPKVLSTAIDEMMIAANPAFQTYMGLSRAAANLLLRHGSPELQEKYVPRLITGEWQGTMCLTEAGAGTDVGASMTRATPVGDGTYKIQGTKTFITAGDHQLAENHVHLVLARLPDAPAGVKGLSLFLVPKFRFDDAGEATVPNDIFCSKIEEKMGIHGSCTTVLNFGDNDNCTGYLVGEENRGIACMFHMMNEERIVVGLQGQALAAAMYTNARQYASERIQGSDIGKGKSMTGEKVTIDNHPDVRRMLMTVRALAEGGRALLYYTSIQQDLAIMAEDEHQRAYHDGRNALLTPVCKAWGSDSGVEACSVAVQVYGGAGYCRDYPAEQALRDARIAPIYEGTNGIQAIDLLMRKVFGSGGKLFESFMNDLGTWIARHAAHAAVAQEVAQLKLAQEELVTVTKHLGKLARADVRHAALGASPYLTLFGNVTVGWLLLDQAVRAQKALEAFDIPADPAEIARFFEDNERAKFYAAKLETARFFVYQILSRNRWLAVQILSDDRSALDICL